MRRGGAAAAARSDSDTSGEPGGALRAFQAAREREGRHGAARQQVLGGLPSWEDDEFVEATQLPGAGLRAGRGAGVGDLLSGLPRSAEGPRGGRVRPPAAHEAAGGAAASGGGQEVTPLLCPRIARFYRAFLYTSRSPFPIQGDGAQRRSGRTPQPTKCRLNVLKKKVLGCLFLVALQKRGRDREPATETGAPMKRPLALGSWSSVTVLGPSQLTD